MRRVFHKSILPMLLLIVIFIAGLSACNMDNRGENPFANPVVLEKTTGLLDAIKAGDYERAAKKYPQSYFLKQTPESWIQKLKTLHEDRGVMQSYKLRQSQADTRFSGKFYILEYTAIHEGDKRVNHIITLIAPVEGGDIKIIGHKMTPWLDERLDEKAGSRPK